MKKLIPVLVVIAVMVMASIALARGAPNKKAFTAQAIVSVDVSPTVANVPPMTTGFDVIQNISEPAYSRFASVNHYTDVSEATGLSTTVDKRFTATGSYSVRSGPQPDLVLLA